MNIRTLRADEIEARVSTVSNGKGCSLLLYKDARCDMKILDEVFGWDGWKREHSVIDGRLYCTVSVWSEKQKQWITKQDVGTESYTEKEKGQASDSFKRACFNVGIGRELYTAPFIWVNLNSTEFNAKGQPNISFSVKEIGYNDKREINKLIIVDSKGAVRYELIKRIVPKSEEKKEPQKPVQSHEDEVKILLGMIAEAKDIKQLNSIYYINKEYQKDIAVLSALTKRKEELQINPTSLKDVAAKQLTKQRNEQSA